MSRYIPPDYLLDAGRVIRQPLPRWLQRLRVLSRTGTSIGDQVGNLMEAVNNLALIELLLGDRPRASRLCRMQVRYIKVLVDATGDESFVSLAIQPWINLGRLSRHSANEHLANRYFDLFPDHRRTKPVRVGAFRFSCQEWQAFLRRHDLSNFVARVQIAETARTFLLAGDGQAAWTYIAQMDKREEAECCRLTILEAQVMALSLLSHTDEMLTLARGDLWHQSPFTRLVSAGYSIAALLQGTKRGVARSLLHEAVQSLPPLAVQQPSDPSVLRFVRYLANLSAIVRDREAQAHLADLGCAGAQNIDDVLLYRDFVVHKCTASDDRAGIGKELGKVEASSLLPMVPRDVASESEAHLKEARRQMTQFYDELSEVMHLIHSDLMGQREVSDERDRGVLRRIGARNNGRYHRWAIQ